MHATELAAIQTVSVAQSKGVTYEGSGPWIPAVVYRDFATTVPLIAADAIAGLVSFVMAWEWIASATPTTAAEAAPLCLGFVAGICVANAAVGLYPGIGLTSLAEVRLTSISAAYVGTLFLLVSSLHGARFSAVQLLIITTCTALLFAVPLFRGLTRLIFSRCAWWGQLAVVVGSDQRAESLHSFLSRNRRLGLRPLGIVNEDSHLPVAYAWRSIDRACEIIDHGRSGLLVLAAGRRSHSELRSLTDRLGTQAYYRTVISWLDGSPTLWTRANQCLNWPGQGTQIEPHPLLQGIKRALDLLLTVILGVCLLPLIVVIAVLIRMGSDGPAFFCQERVGRGGRRFIVYKFRTMVCNGDQVLERYLDASPDRRELWDRDHKLADDPRITRIGRVLRKTSLDELPQLWNVLWGEMSLVGPRPILASEIPDFGDRFGDFCNVTPGITGLWQVSGRNQTTYAEHVEMDSYYARNWSLWLDIYIMLLTIRVVLFRHGAY